MRSEIAKQASIRGDRKHAGFTLIELVISIVVFSVLIAGIVVVIQQTAGQSADPMIQQQASAIAQAYLEEIALQSFCDPNLDVDADPATPLNCPVDCSSSACDTGGCRNSGLGATQEAARNLFDDVCDYHGLKDLGAADQNGLPIAGLGAYRVNVTVNDVGVILDTLDSDMGQVVLVNVVVSNPAMESDVVMSVYKANF